jgi:hypothetical protein
MAYFEIFAWLRVHMHSVFGNFIKEVGLRLFSLLLIAVYYDILTVEGFVYATAGLYLALLVTMFYAFSIKTRFSVCHTSKYKEILTYTFILFCLVVLPILLDGDKIMLNNIWLLIILFYSIATFIALVISVPVEPCTKSFIQQLD